MERKSICVLLLIVAMAAMAGWLLTLREKQQLDSELAALRNSIGQAEAMVVHHKQLLSDARLGNALLCRMGLSKDHDGILEFVRSIPAASLSCKTMELPEYPSLQLVWFHHHRQLPDGSILPNDKCKSAAILLNSDSLEIVDYDLHDGFSSVSKSSAEPYYVLNRDQPDGTTISYVVLPSGFQRSN